MNAAEEMIRTLLEQLKAIAKTETIVGEPFQAGEITIVPVSRVSLGVGAGGGGQPRQGEGVGAGGGIKVEPIAFLVVKEQSVSLLNIGRGKGLEALFEKVPELIDKVMEKVSDQVGKKKPSETQPDAPT